MLELESYQEKDHLKQRIFIKMLSYISIASIIIAIIISILSVYNNKQLKRNKISGDLLANMIFRNGNIKNENLSLITEKQKELLLVFNKANSKKKLNLIDFQKIITDTKNSNITKNYCISLLINHLLDQKTVSQKELLFVTKHTKYLESNNIEPFQGSIMLLEAMLYKKMKLAQQLHDKVNFILNLEHIPLKIKEQARILLYI